MEMVKYTPYCNTDRKPEYGTTVYDINSLLYVHTMITLDDLVMYILDYTLSRNSQGVNILLFDDPCTRDKHTKKGEMCSKRDNIPVMYTSTDVSGFIDGKKCHVVSLYRKTSGGRVYVQECLCDRFRKIMYEYDTKYNSMKDNLIIYINNEWLIGSNCKDVYTDIDKTIFNSDRKTEADNMIPLVASFWYEHVARGNTDAYLDIVSVDSDILMTLYPLLCQDETRCMFESGKIRWMRPGKGSDEKTRVVSITDTPHYKSVCVSCHDVTKYVVALMGGSDINRQYIVSISLISDLIDNSSGNYSSLFVYSKVGDTTEIKCNIIQLFRYFKYHTKRADNRKIVNTKNEKNAHITYEYNYKDTTYMLYPTFGYLLDVIIAFMYYCVNMNYNVVLNSLQLTHDEMNSYNSNYYKSAVDVVTIKMKF